jgi:tetratricopeptide (TPR) repeat protein
VAAPDFALAQLLMAARAASVAAWGGPDALAARRDGTAAADRFIAMRPDLADGYVYRALLLPFGNAAERETLLRRAADRPSPYCACAVQFLGDFLAQTGRLREAVALYQQAYDRDQVARLPLLRLIVGLDWLGQNARAGALLDRFEAAHGPDPALRYAHALYLRPRPRSPERPSFSDPALERAVAAALPATASGDHVARARAAALLRAIPVTRANEFPVAALLAELGDGAGALAVADASRRAGDSFAAPGRYPGVTTALMWDPRFAVLWRTPGFAGLLERTGYFAYWHDSRSAPDACRADNAPSFCARIAQDRGS